VLSGKVKYTDRANGKEVLIASGGKYVGGREVKAADDEKAEASAPTNGSSFSIAVPLRQGVWENQPNNQKGGPIDPTQFIPPRFNFTAITSGSFTLSLPRDAVAAVDAVDAVDAVLYVTGDDIPDGKAVGDVKTEAVAAVDAVDAVDAVAAKIESFNILTGGFTETEIEENFESIKAEYGKAGNYQVGGNQLNADEVKIDVNKVPTGDGLFRIEVTITPKGPEGDLGEAFNENGEPTLIAVNTVTIDLPGATIELITPPELSPQGT